MSQDVDYKFTFLGKTVHLEGGVSATDPPEQRMSMLRGMLIRQLGDAKCVEIYNVMNSMNAVVAPLPVPRLIDRSANRNEVASNDLSGISGGDLRGVRHAAWDPQGKKKTKHDARVLQACGLGSSHGGGPVQAGGVCTEVVVQCDRGRSFKPQPSQPTTLDPEP